jgi:hypothetical protein
VNDQSAAGDFIELTDDEKLHRPSFEAMPAGVASSEDARLRRAGGTANHAADSEIDFEEIVIDPTATSFARSRRRSARAVPLLAFGPAAQSQLRTGDGEVRGGDGRLRVGPERFAVAGVATRTGGDEGRRPTSSHAAVTQALERHLRRTRDRGQLQVVAAFLAVA